MEKYTVVPPSVVLAVVLFLQTVSAQRFVIEPSNSTVSKGSTVILECRVADFQGQVQWAWDDLMLGPDVDIPSFSRYSMVGNQATGEYDLMISNADLEDDALFECQMMSSLGFPGKRSRKAKVDVLVPPNEPIIDGAPKVEVVVNKPTNITCHANLGKPAANITWLVNSVPITDNILYNSVVAADGKRQNATSILTLTSKKTDQGKKVECRAINAAIHNHKWMRGQLEVLFPPEVSMAVTPSKKVLKEGDRVRFSCQAVANPSDVTWKWYQDDEELVGAKNSMLDLTSVGREHHKKTISCEATNRVGSSKQSFPLNVEYGPKFTSDAVHVEVDKGKDATLECTVDANPAATIYWKKHGSDRILSSAASYRILSVAEADFGSYTCTATVVSRGFQEISRDVYLLKKGPPVIVSEDSQYAKFGETGKVECDMKAVPKPSTISWTHDGKPLELEKKDRYEVKSYHTIGGYKSTLWIASVQDGDFGNYNCTVANGYGSDMLVITFKQKDAIPIVFILVGVLLGVVIIICITVAVFLYHRKKSSASDAGSQDSDASITKKKKVPTATLR